VTGNVRPGVSLGSGLGIPPGGMGRGRGLAVVAVGAGCVGVRCVGVRCVGVLGGAVVVDAFEATGVEGIAQPVSSTPHATSATTVDLTGRSSASHADGRMVTP
jgi:hypothetical protein